MQQAYLLHARSYRETSQLLDFLTFQSGRIQVVAKGVKASKKKNAVQLFMPYDIDYRGKGELKTLAHHEMVRGRLLSSEVGLSGKSLYCGFYINELLTRLLPKEQALSDVYLLYQNVLAQLTISNDMTSIQIALRQFEFQLLDTLGYGYDYDNDLHNQIIEDDVLYQFVPEQGFIKAKLMSEHPSIFLGADIRSFKNIEYTMKAQSAAKRFMRQALASHLGDKPLKSRELFNTL